MRGLHRRLLRGRGAVYWLAAAGGQFLLPTEAVHARVALTALAVVAGAIGTIIPTSLIVVLWADTAVALGFWWLLGPVAGVDIVLFSVVAGASLLLPRRVAKPVLVAAFISEFAEIPLHLLASRWQLPLMHSAAQVMETGELLIGVGLRSFFLVVAMLLFFSVSAMLGSALAELEDRVRGKDAFIAAIGHAVRTPLTAVIGFAETLRDGVADRDEEREMAGIIADQGREMAGIVDNFVVAARADIGELTLRLEATDLFLAAHNSMDNCSACRSSREVEFVGAETLVIADPPRLRHAIHNLISNAVLYGGEAVTVITGSGDGSGWVDVVDDGPGLPAGVAERAFERYRSEALSTAGSVGLGLAVANLLATAMGGDLAYRRESGSTTFRLTLPLAGIQAAVA